MESQNNPISLKPSRRFLVRGGIASGILALILIVQTHWFLSLFSKKQAAMVAVSDVTVGEAVGKDSNSNGIADWEEQLWGLDPTVATTNGVSNKFIIEEKRRTLQGGSTQTESLNETDRLARELFSFTTAVGTQAAVTNSSLSAMASKLGTQNISANTLPVYTLKNIVTIQTNRNNLVSYEKNLSAVLSTYNTNLPDIATLITSVETGDYSTLENLNTTILYYASFSKKLSKIPVPVGAAQYHLDIINSVAGIGRAFEKIKVLEENGINALVGLSEYRYHDEKLTASIEALTRYLNEYGILQ